MEHKTPTFSTRMSWCNAYLFFVRDAFKIQDVVVWSLYILEFTRIRSCVQSMPLVCAKYAKHLARTRVLYAKWRWRQGCPHLWPKSLLRVTEVQGAYNRWPGAFRIRILIRSTESHRPWWDSKRWRDIVWFYHINGIPSQVVHVARDHAVHASADATTQVNVGPKMNINGGATGTSNHLLVTLT